MPVAETIARLQRKLTAASLCAEDMDRGYVNVRPADVDEQRTEQPKRSKGLTVPLMPRSITFSTVDDECNAGNNLSSDHTEDDSDGGCEPLDFESDDDSDDSDGAAGEAGEAEEVGNDDHDLDNCCLNCSRLSRTARRLRSERHALRAALEQVEARLLSEVQTRIALEARIEAAQLAETGAAGAAVVSLAPKCDEAGADEQNAVLRTPLPIVLKLPPPPSTTPPAEELKPHREATAPPPNMPSGAPRRRWRLFGKRRRQEPLMSGNEADKISPSTIDAPSAPSSTSASMATPPPLSTTGARRGREARRAAKREARAEANAAKQARKKKTEKKKRGQRDRPSESAPLAAEQGMHQRGSGSTTHSPAAPTDGDTASCQPPPRKKSREQLFTAPAGEVTETETEQVSVPVPSIFSNPDDTNTGERAKSRKTLDPVPPCGSTDRANASEETTGSTEPESEGRERQRQAAREALAAKRARAKEDRKQHERDVLEAAFSIIDSLQED